MQLMKVKKDQALHPMLHDFSGKTRCFQILRLKEEDVDSCNEFGWERHLADGYET